MHTIFGPDFFTQNRIKLRESLESDVPIIITGNGNMQRAGDEPSSFHQDSSFWYLTGLNGTDLTLFIDGDETHVIVPGRSSVREAFDGIHDIAAYAAQSGITSILNEKEGWNLVRECLKQRTTIATLGSAGAYVKQYGLYTLPFRRQLITKLKRIHPGITIHDIRQNIAQLRVMKQPEELVALQRAIDTTTQTLSDVATKHLKTAQYEYELEAALTYGFRSRGATGHGFAPIVGAGAHSTTLHHVSNNGAINLSDLIVLDVGAEYEQYSADITRTVSKQPLTGRKAEVFRAVIAVQDYALSLIKPGLIYREYEKLVEAYMGSQLQSLGLITEPNSESIRHYFPHATSHFLGLDVHDVGNYHEPLQSGMVITCEPGIYIPEEGIGIRIEDDVLLTVKGNEVLSHTCSRELTPVQ